MRVATTLLLLVFVLGAAGHGGARPRIEGYIVGVGHSFSPDLTAVYRVVPGEEGLPRFSGLDSEHDRLRAQELMLAYLTAPESDQFAAPAEGAEYLILVLTNGDVVTIHAAAECAGGSCRPSSERQVIAFPRVRRVVASPRLAAFLADRSWPAEAHPLVMAHDPLRDRHLRTQLYPLAVAWARARYGEAAQVSIRFLGVERSGDVHLHLDITMPQRECIFALFYRWTGQGWRLTQADDHSPSSQSCHAGMP